MKKYILAIIATLATTVAQAEFTGYTPEELKAMSVEDIQNNFGLTPGEAKMSQTIWKGLSAEKPAEDIKATLTSNDILTYHFAFQNIVGKKITFGIRYDIGYIKMEDGRTKSIYDVDDRYVNLRTEVTCEGPYGTYTTETVNSGKYQKPIAFDPICVFYNTDYYLSSYNEGDESKKEEKAEELRNMSQLDYTAMMNKNGVTFISDKELFNALYNFPNLPTSLKEGEYVDVNEFVGKDYDGSVITKPVRYTLINPDMRRWSRMDSSFQKEFTCISDYANADGYASRNPLCVFYNEIQKASM